MTAKRESVPYSALPGTVLRNVEVSRCEKCGEYEVAIPAIDQLNNAIAARVIEKRGRLAGAEIRFLRTVLGYSGADFAKLIRSSASTVSRWESGQQPIGHHADMLVRALIVIDQRMVAYPIAQLGALAGARARAQQPRYVFARTARGWGPGRVQNRSGR